MSWSQPTESKIEFEQNQSYSKTSPRQTHEGFRQDFPWIFKNPNPFKGDHIKEALFAYQRKVAPWSTAAREAMNQQDGNKTGSPEACVALESLPFSGEDFKVAMKTNAETVKALRAAIPKRAAAKSKAKEIKEDMNDKDAQEPKAKRRRVKSAA